MKVPLAFVQEVDARFLEQKIRYSSPERFSASRKLYFDVFALQKRSPNHPPGHRALTSQHLSAQHSIVETHHSYLHLLNLPH